MKIVTVLGTRPEIIRLSLIIKKLDQLADHHVLVHTGQNFTQTLSNVFFEELDVRKPDYILHNQQQSLGEQLATMYKELEKIFLKEKPDKVLVLGDTNSALSAILAERMGIPVVHMEAGNRCFDWSVPEEKNRRVIDAISTFNLPYTPQSRENLLKEGMASNRIYVSGNPIYEVLKHHDKKIEASAILDELQLTKESYFLVTAHRAENVDNEHHLTEILKALNLVAETYSMPVICSIHPRTQARLKQRADLTMHSLVEFHEPFGFFDFVKLEKHARCVLTDSGTVQEECCLFHVPTVTIRRTTERPETIACGSNIVTGLNAKHILQSVNVMVSQSPQWLFPIGYTDEDVSDKVVKFLMGGLTIVPQ
ncbi:non-hydrolyzing UDP-N-acetylglucosamine 2-epimerase [Pseudalkalibacillus hwajinpoensis]|uniref:UDP-N-acetylglucosamine 2-epimerase (Non-hydrolyzing) n=1 Tax=Guptibacillus hwajinpoensis TaxID=208199 RepID=A0A4U1MMQ9_9BACL|nr:UDP-N-acetylglucosamine 2-epimerase (non-hydrolyzing) [Pseudalkalibacillus hwajinpoensis]TKD71862.1 UDP-N-acetylglucosamine 2-epimerase (non-hydrolyzing) [Pseudalkalibacillus hwajinpoensis]